MKKAALIIFTILSFNLLLIAPLCFGQNQKVTAEIKKQTIDDLSALLPELCRYLGENYKNRIFLLSNSVEAVVVAFAQTLYKRNAPAARLINRQ